MKTDNSLSFSEIKKIKIQKYRHYAPDEAGGRRNYTFGYHIYLVDNSGSDYLLTQFNTSKRKGLRGPSVILGEKEKALANEIAEFLGVEVIVNEEMVTE